MIVVGDWLIRIGGYVVEPVRSMRRAVARAASSSGLDAGDLQAVVAVGIYLTLGTVVVAWAASMFILVRWIVGA